MKTKKRALLVVLAAVLLLSVTVLGTMAWLYDTETIGYDAFTVGDVQLKIVGEAAFTEPQGDDELVPNQRYEMNPTVTIEANSEECYVRVLVTVTDTDDLVAAATAAGQAADVVDGVFQINNYFEDMSGDWTYKGVNTHANNVTADATVYEYWYTKTATVAEAAADTELAALFSNFTCPWYLNNNQITALGADGDALTFTFEAQAIQADLNTVENIIDDAETAWEQYEWMINNNANTVNQEDDTGDNFAGAWTVAP